jgi:hypothetical protein
VWSLPQDIDRIIAGLASFLAQSDVALLDRALSQRGGKEPSKTHEIHATCEARVRTLRGTIDRAILRCGSPSSNETEAIGIEGVLYFGAGGAVSGTLQRLSFGDGDEVVGLHVVKGAWTGRADSLTVHFAVAQPNNSFNIRRADGLKVKDIQIDLHRTDRRPRGSVPSESMTGTVTGMFVDDVSPVHQAIDDLVRATLAGETDVLVKKPFRRASVMRALSSRLGMEPMRWCCEATEGMPPPVTDRQTADHDLVPDGSGRSAGSAMKLLHRYCGECHHGDQPFPPNFLHGSPQEIDQNVGHCAERMLSRLEMARRPLSERSEAPMPPYYALQRYGVVPERWPGHDDFLSIKRYLEDVAKSQPGKATHSDASLGRDDYEELPPCSASSVPSVDDTAMRLR